MRDTIFIGHANPEDNEFTLWLYHKLSNEGYKVACDLVNLTGGESDFWKTLQEILDNQTCKYLLVFSRLAFTKQGVIDEWEQVRAIGKREKISDFVALLKIDDVQFDQRIGTVTMNQFRFDKSWAEGLKNLTKKLYLDDVPRQISSLSVNDWLKNKYTTSFAGLKKVEEKYHSNWVEINSIPPVVYFYKYANDTQAKTIHKEIDSYPIIQHDSYLITFLEAVPKESFGHDFEIVPKSIIPIETKKCFEFYAEKDFPDFHDLRRFVVRLLKQSFFLYLKGLGLSEYGLSSKNSCFFYVKDFRQDNRVFFDFEGKKTRKDLVGEFFEAFWHYAISFRPLYHPFFCFAIKGHLVFTDDGIKAWNDKDKQHSARRNKGKRFFNKEWRSMMLAFLHSLSGDGSEIILPGNEKISIVVNKEPIIFFSEIGYSDPVEKGREVPIDYYEDDEEIKGNLESEYGEQE